jgi:hypothetical protein
MNTLTLINQYPNKTHFDPYINFNLLDLISHKVLDSILNSDYKYETLDFGKKIENKTTKLLLKTITKTIEYDYNLVYQDIVSKQFNGLKTVISLNTKMHRIFKQYEKAKPLNIFNLKFKKINHSMPRVREFYNLTGFTKGFKTFQFFDLITHDYASHLKPFGEVKAYIVSSLAKALTQHFSMCLKSLFITQHFRKTKFIIRINGFKLKITNKLLFRYSLRFIKSLNIKPFNFSLTRKKKKKALFYSINKFIHKKMSFINPYKKKKIYIRFK